MHTHNSTVTESLIKGFNNLLWKWFSRRRRKNGLTSVVCTVENVPEGNNCTQESWNINKIIKWLSWHSTVNAGSFRPCWQTVITVTPTRMCCGWDRLLDDGPCFLQVQDLLFPYSNGWKSLQGFGKWLNTVQLIINVWTEWGYWQSCAKPALVKAKYVCHFCILVASWIVYKQM